MNTFGRKTLVALAFCGLSLAPAACGVAYQNTNIREGIVDGAKVRVIQVTPETVMAANRQPYNPRSVPAAFRMTAGTVGSGRPAGADPAPARRQGTRPDSIETRLPPELPIEPYRIGVGDVVLLATKTAGTGVAELTGLLAAESRRQGYTVQDEGSIAIPDIGRVRLVGLTLEEAETVLFQRMLERQIDPSFSLEISEFNARKVSIGGAVVRPGVAPITLTPLTLDNALAATGGIALSERATAAIRIYREGRLYQIPVESFLTRPDYQKIRLRDGDSVFVDSEYDLDNAEAFFQEQIRLAEFRQGRRSAELSQLSQEIAIRRADLQEQRQNFTDRLSLDAEPRDYVFVVGEVLRPGRWTLPFDRQASIADALYANGGVLSRTGNPRQIYVLRGSPDPREFGSTTAWHIDAGSPTGLVLLTRMELRPNDVIHVAPQAVTKWSRVIDQISPSLIAIPLNSAVQD